jgi:3'-phosphoadenosine 5'-phosphosulfate (PAPS) 3'-phosphatase
MVVGVFVWFWNEGEDNGSGKNDSGQKRQRAKAPPCGDHSSQNREPQQNRETTTKNRCIDPIDGTCNFAHGYPGFCCSVGVLRHSTPVAGVVIEFVGGPGKWETVRARARARVEWGFGGGGGADTLFL